MYAAPTLNCYCLKKSYNSFIRKDLASRDNALPLTLLSGNFHYISILQHFHIRIQRGVIILSQYLSIFKMENILSLNVDI